MFGPSCHICCSCVDRQNYELWHNCDLCEKGEYICNDCTNSNSISRDNFICKDCKIAIPNGRDITLRDIYKLIYKVCNAVEKNYKK